MAEITLKELNKEAAASPEKMVREAEERYRDCVTSLADRVAENKNIRIILLAGPSGSGKTTTANLLSDAIKAHGETCSVISLDNFYRDSADPDYPRLPNGDRDLECLEALDLPEVHKCLENIAYGREYELPKYDFKVARRVSSAKCPPIDNGCVVIEGLHAITPRLSDSLPKEKLLKLFVSVSTNINSDGRRILSGRKTRFVRRLVRDNIYRGADAEHTLSVWDDVLHGEDQYLYPFKGEADVQINTFHSFELGVMKHLAVSLLTDEIVAKNSYAGVVRRALERVTDIPSDLVPKTSLIREFISGGIYEELY